ncbi:hypothetical protein LPJ59_004529, partial [Coemansia sp. RSA 2399]
ESSAQEQQVWIAAIDIVSRNDPNLLATSIFVAVDNNIIADFSAWVNQDPTRGETWASLKSYLTTVRHPRNKPVDMIDELLHLRPNGSIEAFNETFRQLWQSAGGRDDEQYGIASYRFLMPTALREILIRQEPSTLSSAMQLCKNHVLSIIRAGLPVHGEPMEIDTMSTVPFPQLFEKKRAPTGAKKRNNNKDVRPQNRLIDETRKRGIADADYHARMEK